MLRSAAKNHESVTVVVDPADYTEVARQIAETGATTLELRRKLFGNGDPQVASALSGLGMTLRDQGKLALDDPMDTRELVGVLRSGVFGFSDEAIYLWAREKPLSYLGSCKTLDLPTNVT